MVKMFGYFSIKIFIWAFLQLSKSYREHWLHQ